MQTLFNLMSEKHDLILLESELQEILRVAEEVNEVIKKRLKENDDK